MDLELRDLERREAGFSVVEALIATAILLIIAIGMIPLFARAMINNALGNDYTQATAHGTTNTEKIWKQPFQSTDLQVTTGSSRQQVQYVEKGIQTGTPVTDLDWEYTPTSTTKVVWTRTTRVRQFKITALDDGELSDTEVVPAGADPGEWQIMETTTLLDSGKVKSGPTPLASIRQTNLQYLKAF